MWFLIGIYTGPILAANSSKGYFLCNQFVSQLRYTVSLPMQPNQC